MLQNVTVEHKSASHSELNFHNSGIGSAHTSTPILSGHTWIVTASVSQWNVVQIDTLTEHAGRSNEQALQFSGGHNAEFGLVQMEVVVLLRQVDQLPLFSGRRVIGAKRDTEGGLQWVKRIDIGERAGDRVPVSINDLMPDTKSILVKPKCRRISVCQTRTRANVSKLQEKQTKAH